MKYCVGAENGNWKGGMTAYVCTGCGKPFMRYACWMKDTTRPFCSRRCCNTWLVGHNRELAVARASKRIVRQWFHPDNLPKDRVMIDGKDPKEMLRKLILKGLAGKAVIGLTIIFAIMNVHLLSKHIGQRYGGQSSLSTQARAMAIYSTEGKE